MTVMLVIAAASIAQIRELENGDILIADFEGETYGDWKVEGTAFGNGPVRGTLEGQMEVFGFKGKGLVNSFLGGDEPTGKLISPEFTLDKDFVNFLIGGGGDMKRTFMRLMVLWDDEWHLFRIATGPNKEPGGSEELAWESWDVSEEIGATARIEIIDDASGGWGHINVDHIVLSDSSFVTILPDHEREITITDNYMHFPVDTEARQRLVKVQKDMKSVREFQIRLAEGEPDFWVYLEIHDFIGETLTLSTEQKRSDSGNLFDRITTRNEPKNHETFYTEKLRPQFHYSNPRGWNNDPNGMVYYKGEYHLFYQRNPFGWPWGNMTWGHAVSTDMMHWKNLPDALHPDAMGTMFSGTGKVDTFNSSGFRAGEEDPILLFYTAAGGTNPWSKGVPFTQCVAYSNDRGRTFTKWEGNPIIGHIRGGNRDPKVLWHEPSKKWVLVLYIEEEEMAFFNSDDLKHWTETSRIKGFHECPELFELPVDGDKSNMKWVLYGAPGNYQIGSFDGKTFTPEGPNRRYNFGNAFYALSLIHI